MNKLEDFTKNPFVVPDNFFDQFNEEIMTKLPPKQPQKVKKVKFSVRKYILPWVAVAALMSGVIFTFRGSLFPAQSQQTKAEVSNSVEFASSDDRDFYLYLEDDATNKELISGVLTSN